MRSCCCVCTEWNDLISSAKKLAQRKNSIDPYQPINFQYRFGQFVKGAGAIVYPIGVCSVLGKVIISDHNNHRIQIFDETGQQYIKSFGSRGNGPDQLSYPYGICIVGQMLWISDYGNNRIQIFDSNDGTPIHSVSLDNLSPLGICCNSNGQVLVTTYENIVLSINQDSYSVEQFNSGKFDWPRGICCNSRDEVLVLDSRVQIFSKDGVFLHSVRPKVEHENKGMSFRGVCTDWENNIFVGHDNKISIFNSEGLLIQQIDASQPLDICQSRGKMIVTSGNNCVEIFSNKV